VQNAKTKMLYGYLIIREEHRLRVVENRVLRRICGRKRDEKIGRQRKLNNEELRNLHPSPNTSRMILTMRMRWSGHVACMGEDGIQDFGRRAWSK
jgi:hypothetical protein